MKNSPYQPVYDFFHQHFAWPSQDRMPRLAMGHSLGAKLQAFSRMWRKKRRFGNCGCFISWVVCVNFFRVLRFFFSMFFFPPHFFHQQKPRWHVASNAPHRLVKPSCPEVLLCCQRPDPMLSGVALLAFNNFGVEDQAWRKDQRKDQCAIGLITVEWSLEKNGSKCMSIAIYMLILYFLKFMILIILLFHFIGLFFNITLIKPLTYPSHLHFDLQGIWTSETGKILRWYYLWNRQ